MAPQKSSHLAPKGLTYDEAAGSQMLYTNLQLLEMDMLDMESKYKVPFNKEMFNLINKAGSEAVLYFLFNRLDPSECRNKFRDCWPVYDKKDAFAFRKECTNWLTLIQKDHPQADLPPINSSLLLSPGGRKFIRLLHKLSDHVMMTVMKLENDALLDNTTLADEAQVLQASYERDQREHFELMHLKVAATRQWQQHIASMVKEHRGLVKHAREQQTEKLRLVTATAQAAVRAGVTLPARHTLDMFDTDTDAYAIKRRQTMKKVENQWKKLTEFSSATSEHRGLVRSLISETLTSTTLDGADLGVRVPGLLLRECKKEIIQHEIESVYIGGKVNLTSVLQLWNIALRQYIERLESEPLPDVTAEVPGLRQQITSHHSLYTCLHKDRDSMTQEIIPQLGQIIHDLQGLLQSQSEPPEHELDPCDLDLGLTSHTPSSKAHQRPHGSVKGGLTREGGPAREGGLPARLMNQLLDAVQESPDGTIRLANQLEDQIRHARKQPGTKSKYSLNFENVAQPQSAKKPSEPSRTKTRKLASKPSSKPEDKSKVARGRGRPDGGPDTSRGKNLVPALSKPKEKKKVESGPQSIDSSTISAMNVLADSIVAGMMGSSDDDDDNESPRLHSATLLSPLSEDSSPLAGGGLDQAAFTSHNRVGRSPDVGGGGARPVSLGWAEEPLPAPSATLQTASSSSLLSSWSLSASPPGDHVTLTSPAKALRRPEGWNGSPEGMFSSLTTPVKPSQLLSSPLESSPPKLSPQKLSTHERSPHQLNLSQSSSQSSSHSITDYLIQTSPPPSRTVAENNRLSFETGLLDFTNSMSGESLNKNRLSMGFLGRTLQPDLVDLEEESDLPPDLVDLDLEEESDVDPIESFSPMKGGIQVQGRSAVWTGNMSDDANDDYGENGGDDDDLLGLDMSGLGLQPSSGIEPLHSDSAASIQARIAQLQSQVSNLLDDSI